MPNKITIEVNEKQICVFETDQEFTESFAILWIVRVGQHLRREFEYYNPVEKVLGREAFSAPSNAGKIIVTSQPAPMRTPFMGEVQNIPFNSPRKEIER